MTVIANYQTRPGKGDGVAAVLAKHAATSRAEPGCLQFVVHRCDNDPDRFVLYEQYADEAAFQVHRESQHFAENIETTVAPLLAERTWRRYHTVGSQAG